MGSILRGDLNEANICPPPPPLPPTDITDISELSGWIEAVGKLIGEEGREGEIRTIGRSASFLPGSNNLFLRVLLASRGFRVETKRPFTIRHGRRAA